MKNTKARLRLSETEVAILKAILPGRQFSFTLIYLAAQDLYQSIATSKVFSPNPEKNGQ
ncbi:hypothetical protein [Desulfonauticus submarinus]